MNKVAIKIFGFSLLAVSLVSTSCQRDVTKPGREYMPNMYRGPQSNTYAPSALFSDSASARLPESGTVPRGYTTYNEPNSPDAYLASLERKLYPSFAPAIDESNLSEGARLYTRFCVNCHGAKGDGNGNLMEQGKFAGVPSYDATRLPQLTPYSIFHVITHGKGVMGSHAAQIETMDRWRIVQHVLKLRSELNEQEFSIPAEAANATPQADAADIENQNDALTASIADTKN